MNFIMVLVIWSIVGLIAELIITMLAKDEGYPHITLIKFTNNLNIFGKIFIWILVFPALITIYTLALIIILLVVIFEFLFVKK